MARHRFVVPEIVKIPLADVYRRELDRVNADLTHKDESKRTTQEDVAKAEAALADAVADGAWIKVKKYLNTGETQEMFAKMRAADGKVDPSKVGLARCEAYIVEWSFTDAAGKPVPFSVSAMRNLHRDDFSEIRDAVDAHEEIQREAREEAKKSRAGETASSATS